MPGLTTNPNLGRGQGYDTRNDLGYGKTDSGSGVGGGPGSPWAVSGNAGIYKEKSEYEKELDQERFEQDKEDDTDVEELEVDVKLKQKSFTSTSKAVSDFGSKYGTDPFSYNGLANTMQFLGINSSYNRGENILKEFIREALQEELLREVTSMSVRIMTKGTVGDPYKKSKANVSNVNQMSPGDPSIKQRGYDNNNRKARTPDKWPYSLPDEHTGSGSKITNCLDDDIASEFEWDNNSYTTGKYLYDTTKQEYVDEKNLRNHIKKTKFNLNR